MKMTLTLRQSEEQIEELLDEGEREGVKMLA